MADPRFGAVFTNKDYSIDPTQPDYRGTAQMDKLIEERQRRVKKQRQGKEAAAEAQQAEDGLADMVSKIKRQNLDLSKRSVNSSRSFSGSVSPTSISMKPSRSMSGVFTSRSAAERSSLRPRDG